MVCVLSLLSQEAVSLLKVLQSKNDMLQLAESKLSDNPSGDEMEILEGRKDSSSSR